jgi:hypothetical protein
VIIASRYLTHTEIIKRGNTRESNIQKEHIGFGENTYRESPYASAKNVTFWREGRE